MKVALKQKPFPGGDRPGARVISWKKSLPFLVNPRAVLVHRVRSVHSFTGNGARGEFVADPPKDRLLCAYCEAKAVAAGEKPADQLAGRHVCIGTMKAKRQCCLGTEN